MRGDGAEIDIEEDDDEGGAGVYNEIEVSDGEEACRILEERLGFDEVRGRRVEVNDACVLSLFSRGFSVARRRAQEDLL